MWCWTGLDVTIVAPVSYFLLAWALKPKQDVVEWSVSKLSVHMTTVSWESNE
jgi:hypothetical protein